MIIERSLLPIQSTENALQEAIAKETPINLGRLPQESSGLFD